MTMTEKSQMATSPESRPPELEQAIADPGPYTTWTSRDRALLICLLGYLCLASSLTANIYFPLIDLLADRYGVSAQAINLTITLFFVLQGIAPSFWSPLSDSFGRRPVYLATFAVYALASLGLSVADRTYPALLLLRALQSVGGSAVLSLSYAVVADVTVHAERGRWIAPMMTATNIGPCFGPVIGGGAVLATGDPRWCFRALLIFGASAFVLIALFLPETGRHVVGNGAVPAKGIWRTWFNLLANVNRPSFISRCLQKHRLGPADGEGEKQSDSTQATDDPVVQVNVGKTGRGKAVFPNPFLSLRIVFYPDTFLTLWLAGSPYALWFCVQTSITPIFGQHYGFNPLYVGLCFLAGGVGIIAGGFVAGKLMDWNYRKVAAAEGLPIDRKRGDDIERFPIEQARSRGSITIILLSLGVVIGYGWIVARHVHPAVLLVFQIYLGCRCTALHQTYSALIVDIFPDRPGTAAASNNITRCTLAALAVAVLDPLTRVLGYGWLFTLLGLLDAVGSIAAVLALRKWGRSWRNRRTGKSVAV